MRSKPLIIGSLIAIGLLLVGASQSRYFKSLKVGKLSGVYYVDGRAYDTIQEAHDDMPATGGTIIVPDGNRTIGGTVANSQVAQQLNLTKSTQLKFGQGTYTFATPTDGAGIMITSSDVTVSGIPGQTVLSASMVSIPDAASNETYNLIEIRDTTAAIDNVHINNMKLRLTITASCDVAGDDDCNPRIGVVRFGGSQSNGFVGGNGFTNISATHLDVKLDAIDADNSDEKFYGLYSYGYQGSTAVPNIVGVNFSNNYFKDSDGRHLQVFFSDSATVIGNVIIDPNNGVNANIGARGIRISASDETVVMGNTVTLGSTSNGSCYYFAGINGDGTWTAAAQPEGFMDNLVVTGNTCFINSTTLNLTEGMYIPAGVRDSVIANNVIVGGPAIVDTDGWGILFDDTLAALGDYSNSEILVMGNYVQGFPVSQIRVSSGNDRIFLANNFLSDEVGAWFTDADDNTVIGPQYILQDGVGEFIQGTAKWQESLVIAKNSFNGAARTGLVGYDDKDQTLAASQAAACDEIMALLEPNEAVYSDWMAITDTSVDSFDEVDWTMCAGGGVYFDFFNLADDPATAAGGEIIISATCSDCDEEDGAATWRPLTGEVTLTNAGVTNVVIPSGAFPPATCIQGELFIDTDETDTTNCTTVADNSLCVCVATDSWASTE